MNFFSRSWFWSRPSGTEPGPGADPPPEMPADGNAESRSYFQPDEGDWNRRNNGRRLNYAADGSDTSTSWRTHSSRPGATCQAGHRGRAWGASPSGASSSNSGGPRPQRRSAFWDSERSPASEREIAGNNAANAAEPDRDDSAAPGWRPPRFRDVDIEFNHNQIQDLSGGARAVTGFRAERDFKARIHHNRFGRLD